MIGGQEDAPLLAPGLEGLLEEPSLQTGRGVNQRLTRWRTETADQDLYAPEDKEEAPSGISVKTILLVVIAVVLVVVVGVTCYQAGMQRTGPFDAQPLQSPTVKAVASAGILLTGAAATDLPTCERACTDLGLYGRWRAAKFGLLCPDPFDTTKPEGCWCMSSSGMNCKGEFVESSANDESGNDGDSAPATSLMQGASSRGGGRMLKRARSAASSGSEISHTSYRGMPKTRGDVVHEYCDVDGMKAMHGEAALDPEPVSHVVESQILADVARQLDSNNVDQMSKDVFSFYVCVRWLPDNTFWSIVEQELASDLPISKIVDRETPLAQAIAELYQKFHFVPLVCSDNFKAWGEMDEHGTHFGKFRDDVRKFSHWLRSHGSGQVAKYLSSADDVFCGEGSKMNAKVCTFGDALLRSMKSWTGNLFGSLFTSSVTQRYEQMHEIFAGLDTRKAAEGDNGEAASWNEDLQEWHKTFPFKSFIHKSSALSSTAAPTAQERVVVCFGQRIASELHRRPEGLRMMTDQNNVGCHGFWDVTEAGNMINRMVDLWKPPTCLLSGMAYTMKRDMLNMFSQLNERLFDALPSLVADEEADAMGGDDNRLPTPPEISSDGILADGLTVRALTELSRPGEEAPVVVPLGSLGSVAVKGGRTTIAWVVVLKSGKTAAFSWEDPSTDEVKELQVLSPSLAPQQQGNRFVTSFLSGMSAAGKSAAGLYDNMFHSSRYSSMAELMSDSVSKWVVCPIKNDADLSQLDSVLGTEDTAFASFQQEAYKKWSGFEGKIPGEECLEGVLDDQEFPGCKVCEVSTLLSDHIEPYFHKNGEKEEFICPLSPPLVPTEQLTILQQHSGQCLLRMTPHQLAKASWVYNGDRPNRLQNERKENVPSDEYELLRLMSVPGGGKGAEEKSIVSFGRWCSVEELKANRRFCDMPELHNKWKRVEGMATEIAELLVTSHGVGARTVATAVNTYRRNLLGSKNLAEAAKTAAVAVRENVWDSLTGAGRLTKKLADASLSVLVSDVKGSKRRERAFEESLLGTGSSGSVLHALSFQKRKAAAAATSNTREKFSRYVVTCPCRDFDPATSVAMKKKWSSAALRVLVAASAHVVDPLIQPTFEAEVRGELVNFKRKNSAAADAEFGSSRLAVRVRTSGLQPSNCGNIDACNSHACVLEHSMMRGSSCNHRGEMPAETGAWAFMNDMPVSQLMGALVHGTRADSLYALKMTFHCAPKNAFGPTGQPTGPLASRTLRQCVTEGASANAQMRVKEPHRLYFPNEVVVVVRMASDSNDQQTYKTEAGKRVGVEDAHLTASDLQDAPQSYVGLSVGGGFPEGTLDEVVLQPEDVLEALRLI